ncbi:hypothetical protein ACFQX8_24935 [Klenkia terrae]|uniref:hypothetical protein n=1 Tax=Klenkia terrae TaxID=1052259 RepID=UPI00360F41E2
MFFAMSNFFLFIIAVIIGAVVGGVAVTLAKSVGRTPEAAPAEATEAAMVGAPSSTTGAAVAAS